MSVFIPKTRYSFLAGILVAGGLLFSGCESKSDGSGGGLDPMASPVTVTEDNAGDALGQSYAAVTSVYDTGYNLTEMTASSTGAKSVIRPFFTRSAFKEMAITGKTTADRTPLTDVSGTYCPDGGSASLTMEGAAVKLVFTNCKEIVAEDGTYTRNGTVTATNATPSGYDNGTYIEGQINTAFSGGGDSYNSREPLEFTIEYNNGDDALKFSNMEYTFNASGTIGGQSLSFAWGVEDFNYTQNADYSDVDYSGKISGTGMPAVRLERRLDGNPRTTLR